MDAKTGVKQATIEAVVVRADGAREDLGVVSFWHRNLLRRVLWRLGWRR